MTKQIQNAAKQRRERVYRDIENKVKTLVAHNYIGFLGMLADQLSSGRLTPDQLVVDIRQAQRDLKKDKKPLTDEKLTYQDVYKGFWKELVEDQNGDLDKDKVMRELNDYHTCLSEVPKVYDHVTGGAFSKPTTSAEYVIDAADNDYKALYESLKEEE